MPRRSIHVGLEGKGKKRPYPMEAEADVRA